jgi:hypothetical protein
MTCSQGIVFADKYQECRVGGKRLRKKWQKDAGGWIPKAVKTKKS